MIKPKEINIDSELNNNNIETLYKEFAKTRTFEILEDGKKVIKTFDIDLRNKLVTLNLKLVPYVVDKFFGKIPDIKKIRQDLINEGNIGLIEAIPRYEPEYGFKFSTYSIYYVKQKIYNFLDENNKTPSIPIHVKSRMAKILEQNPNISNDDFLFKEKELKEKYGLTDKMFQTVKTGFQKKSIISIDEIFEEKKDIDKQNMNSPSNKLKTLLSKDGEEELQENIFREEIVKIISESVNSLEPRLKNILLLRYNITKV